ncbi:MAG TPA: hypothetical protein VK729_04530 [Silvibacterium sp.]|jgi:uncharacterized damage-inducible protein DinB|nr:hypothetical protein [Silvibacterium sp.]
MGHAEERAGRGLSRPLLDGSRFHCIKDIVMHIPDVENGWTRGDILRDRMVRKDFPVLMNPEGGPVYAEFPLEMLPDYWRAVEQSTLAYVATLKDDELKRLVSMLNRPEERHTVDELLWHVMITRCGARHRLRCSCARRPLSRLLLTC